jgi:hypothetical protein
MSGVDLSSLTGLNPGQITFGSATNQFAQTALLYWDEATSRLGI